MAAATTVRLTKRTKLEKHRAQVLGLLIEGKTHAHIARIFEVSREAVGKFSDRHRDTIAAGLAELAERTRSLALATREQRIHERVWWYDQIKQEAQDHGVVVVERTTETDGVGETASVTVIETRDFRAGMVKEARGLLREIAEELDQLPRGPTPSVEVNVGVLVRYVEGK